MNCVLVEPLQCETGECRRRRATGKDRFYKKVLFVHGMGRSNSENGMTGPNVERTRGIERFREKHHEGGGGCISAKKYFSEGNPRYATEIYIEGRE